LAVDRDIKPAEGAEAGGKVLAAAVASPALLTVERLRAIVQDGHLNFLIGAGTSSAAFTPLGAVEEQLQVLAEGHAGSTASAISRASIQAYFFDGAIAPNKRLLDLGEPGSGLLDAYRRFGRALNQLLLDRRSSLLDKKVSLFTTNVDIAIEIAFERQGLDVADGFVGRFEPTFDFSSFGAVKHRTGLMFSRRSEAPTFDLYKLHGSASWRSSESVIAFDRDLSGLEQVRVALEAARGGLLEIPGPNDVDALKLLEKAAGLELTDEVSAFVAKYDQLQIVNPEKTKFATTVLNETYYELIRRFANALERENSVLLVHGFSFRDEHLRSLVLRAAAANPTLQVIVFCYTRSAEDGYRDLMPDINVPNGNILYVLPDSDEDGHRLDLDVVVAAWLEPLARGSYAEGSEPQADVTSTSD
jgi:hypothetical protein